jgi:hypothetical protein
MACYDFSLEMEVVLYGYATENRARFIFAERICCCRSLFFAVISLLFLLLFGGEGREKSRIAAG